MMNDIKQNSRSSVEKALSILNVFQSTHPSWGVREISNHLGFSPSTVQRLLRILKAFSFVEQNPETRQYRLGNIYFQFIYTLHNTSPLTKTARRFMLSLAFKTQETVHLNVIDGVERLCVDVFESSQNLKAGMPIGSRSPLHAGASSKCLLAFSDHQFVQQYFSDHTLEAITDNTIVEQNRLLKDLKAVIHRGYAESLGERNPGLGSLSAPVFGNRGELLASLSLAIPEIRFQDREHRAQYTQELQKAAKGISEALGFLDESTPSEKQ